MQVTDNNCNGRLFQHIWAPVHHLNSVRLTEAALPDNNDASNILPLQMAECLLLAQSDSVANHVTVRLISINVPHT